MVKALPLLLMLTACGTLDVHQARQDVIGMNLPDLLACAGIPKQGNVMQISPDEALIEYDQDASSAAILTLEVASVANFAIGRPGACKAVFGVFRDGTISRVDFADTSFSMFGPKSDCGPLIEECVHERDATQMPTGYDAFKFLEARMHTPMSVISRGGS